MWRKNFRIRKMQTCMLFLILMLCTTLLNASICILTSLDKPYQKLVEECQSPDVVMYPYNKEESSVMSLKQEFDTMDEIEDVEIVTYHYVTEEISHNGKLIDCFAYLSLYNEAVFGNARVSDGKMSEIPNLGPNDCYLPICIANENDIEVGDTIEISFSDGAISYHVAGLFAEPYSTATAFSCYILVNTLPEGVIKSNNLFFYLKDGKTAVDLEDAYRDAHDGILEGTMSSVNEVVSNGLLAGDIIGGMFLAIGIIMLIVSGLIINFMVRNTMHQDAKNIAVYKTMGYTQSTIQQIYLKFYFAITVAGCITGILCSKFVSNLIMAEIYSNIGEIASVNPFISGIPCMIVTCVFVLLIVFAIVNRSKKVKPVYALNGLEHSNTKKKNYHGNTRFQFSPFGIAIRSILRDKKGILGILITTITTVFSINFAVISLDVAKNMKNQNDYWLGIDRSDVVVTASNEEDMDEIEFVLEADSQIEFYLNDSLGDLAVMLPWEKGQEISTMYAFIYDSYEQAELPVIEGRNPQAANEIAISTKMSEALGKNIGDYMEVYLGGEVKTELLISGLYQNYYSLGKSCRLLKATYDENNYSQNFMNYSIYLKDGTDINSYIDDLSERLGTIATVTKRTEMFPSIMNMIVTPQENAIPAVIALVCIIGGVNIFSIVLLKNHEAEKRNGIYKTIGYTTNHLIQANLLYVLLVAVVSCLIALPINLLTYESIMKLALSMFGFRSYPTSFNYLHLILCNLIILASFTLCTFLSSRSLKRVNVRNLVFE